MKDQESRWRQDWKSWERTAESELAQSGYTLKSQPVLSQLLLVFSIKTALVHLAVSKPPVQFDTNVKMVTNNTNRRPSYGTLTSSNIIVPNSDQQAPRFVNSSVPGPHYTPYQDTPFRPNANPLNQPPSLDTSQALPSSIPAIIDLPTRWARPGLGLTAIISFTLACYLGLLYWSSMESMNAEAAMVTVMMIKLFVFAATLVSVALLFSCCDVPSPRERRRRSRIESERLKRSTRERAG